MIETTRRRGAFLRMALIALVAAGLAACGEDEEEQTPEAPAQAGNVRTYCDKVAQIETATPPPELFDAPPAQQREGAKKFAAQLVPLAEQARTAAPSEIKSDFDVLADTMTAVARTGDFEAFERPPAADAHRRTHAYDLENCGWNRADVTATEYAFRGLPATLGAGITSFEMSNPGKEPHELIVVRIKDGVTESFEQLLRLPQDQTQQKVEILGQAFAAPGHSDWGIFRLRPGRYGVACFIPVQGKENNPPHAARGMFNEFSVS